MAYTVFPATYPQYFPQYNPQLNNYQSSQNGSGIIWVQGIESAKAYQIAPGVTLPLWDSDAQVIYLKSCDASGMPSMKVIDYTIRTEPARKAQNAISGGFGTTPTMQDLNALQGQIDTLRQQIESMREINNESAVQRTEHATREQSAAEVSTVPADISG